MKTKRSKFTVFLTLPDSDPGDPPYWIQVIATDFGSAFTKAVEQAANDMGEIAGDTISYDDFGPVAALRGWPETVVGEDCLSELEELDYE